MERYHIAFIIAMIITFWALYDDEHKAGFTNNDIYFMGGQSNPALSEYIIQPKIINKINLPQEW